MPTQRFDEVTRHLEQAERILRELWADDLPRITVEEADDLVAAHRFIHEALLTLKDQTSHERIH